MRKDEAKLQDKFIALLKKENILYYKTKGGMNWYPTGKNKIVEKEPINQEVKKVIKDNLEIDKIEVLEPEYMQVINKKGFSDIIVFAYRQETMKIGFGNDIKFGSIKKQNTIFIELKTDTSKLRDSQKENFTILKSLGFDCLILRPKHWEQAKLKGKLSFSNLLKEMETYYV